MTKEEMIKLACSELSKISTTLLKQSIESMMEIIMNPNSEGKKSNTDENNSEYCDTLPFEECCEPDEDFYGDYGPEDYYCDDYIYDDFYEDLDNESPFANEITSKPENHTLGDEDSTNSLPAMPDINRETLLDQLELSVRAYNCLKRHGINTLGQLFDMTFDDLSSVRNLGKKSIKEVIDKLNDVRDEYKRSLTLHYTGKEARNDLNYEKTSKTNRSNQPDQPGQQNQQTGQTLLTRPTNIYLEQLNELVGLDEVKEQVKKITAFVKMKQEMPGKSSVPMVLNMEFVGNPGTAKTTVARIMAGLLYEAGLLQSSDIVEVGRSGLVARFTGQTAALVKSVFERAEGRLLFIDEAYALADNDDGGFGDEAITTIVQEMENNRDRTIVVFAGYPDEMEKFFDTNPGLRSRVPFKITFKDYTPDELYKISEIEAKKRGFTISSEAADKVLSLYSETAEDPRMGNGRYCRNMVESAILNYAYRNYGENTGHQPTGSREASKTDYILKAEDFEPLKNMEKTTSSAPIGFRG